MKKLTKILTTLYILCYFNFFPAYASLSFGLITEEEAAIAENIFSATSDDITAIIEETDEETTATAEAESEDETTGSSDSEEGSSSTQKTTANSSTTQGTASAATTNSSTTQNSVKNHKATETFDTAKDNLKEHLSSLGVPERSHTMGVTDIFAVLYGDLMSYAIDPTGNTTITSSSKISTVMQEASNGRTLLKERAYKLFWMLAIIQLCFTMGVEFIGNGIELQVFVAALIRYFITIGFFWYILSKGPRIVGSVASYFLDATQEIVGANKLMGPTACFNMAIEFIYVCVKAVLATISTGGMLNPMPWVIGILAGVLAVPLSFLVMLALVYICSTYVIITFEGLFAVTISMLVLGLGGCRFTWGAIEHVLRMVAQIGLKLMTVILLIFGVNRIALAYMYDITTADSVFAMVPAILQIVCVCLIFALLCQQLPPYIASLIPAGSTGGSGTGFFGMVSSAMHTAGALTSAPSKTVNAAGRMRSNFMGGLRNPEQIGTGGKLSGGGEGWTMAGALGSAAGIGYATTVAMAKAPVAGFELGKELAENADAPLGPVGKAIGKAAGAVDAAAHGIMRAADDPGKAMNNAAGAAVRARKGILSAVDKLGSQGGQGNTAGGTAGASGNNAERTQNSSGNNAAGGTGTASGSAPNTPSASGAAPNTPSASGNNASNTQKPSGNSAVSGTGSAAGAAPNTPSASGNNASNTQKPSGNSAKKAAGKAKASAKSGEGAVFKGKGEMFEAAGFKKGAKPKEDGKK